MNTSANVMQLAFQKVGLVETTDDVLTQLIEEEAECEAVESPADELAKIKDLCKALRLEISSDESSREEKKAARAELSRMARREVELMKEVRKARDAKVARQGGVVDPTEAFVAYADGSNSSEEEKFENQQEAPELPAGVHVVQQADHERLAERDGPREVDFGELIAAEMRKNDRNDHAVELVAKSTQTIMERMAQSLYHEGMDAQSVSKMIAGMRGVVAKEVRTHTVAAEPEWMKMATDEQLKDRLDKAMDTLRDFQPEARLTEMASNVVGGMWDSFTHADQQAAYWAVRGFAGNVQRNFLKALESITIASQMLQAGRTTTNSGSDVQEWMDASVRQMEVNSAYLHALKALKRRVCSESAMGDLFNPWFDTMKRMEENRVRRLQERNQSSQVAPHAAEREINKLTLKSLGIHV